MYIYLHLTKAFVSVLSVFSRGSSFTFTSSTSNCSAMSDILSVAMDFISGSGSYRNLKW